jgi:ABC-type branched-subunit amino acid transport system substrate-binding protein
MACAVASAVAGCGSSGEGTAAASGKAPITILWIGDTTGPLKVYGDVQLAGVKGAADYFNRRGGIEGHRVRVRAVSDNGDPTAAATALTKELASGTPTMVWPGSVSADSAAMIPILAKHDAFAIALVDGKAQCATQAAVKCPHVWSLANPTDVAQQVVVDWIKDRGHTKVGLLQELTPMTAAATPFFLDGAKGAGLTVKTATFPATAVDLTPQLHALQESGAEVVYAEGIGTAQYALTARAKLAWDVPIVFDTSASSLDLTKLTDAKNLGDAYEVALFGQDASLENPGLATMVKWAGRHAKVTALPLSVTGTGWDAVVALNAAVKEAGGSLAVDDLDAAMLKLPPTDPLRTLTRKLGWSQDNHENVLGATDDYSVIGVGPLVNGRVQAP